MATPGESTIIGRDSAKAVPPAESAFSRPGPLVVMTTPGVTSPAAERRWAHASAA